MTTQNRSGIRRSARLFIARAALPVFFASNAFAGSISLITGTSGSLTGVPQSFNETRGVDVTVLSGSAVQVSALSLDGLLIGSASSAFVGARIYDSSSTSLVASSDVTVTSDGSVTVPISATLASGGSFRVSVFVATTPANQGSATLFDPDPPSVGGFPYIESTGVLRINSAHAISTDSFPTNANIFVPQITLATVGDPGTPFCFPGASGVRTCPCGNPPASSTVGCNNFGPNPPGGTGGANLDATGVASIGADTLQFQVTGEIINASNLTVLWQGTTSLPAGAQNGAGVRCVGGTQKRIYKKNAASGSLNVPSGPDPDVHTASANKGFPILPPVTLYYYAAYRNSAAGTPCGNPSLGYNTTNAVSVLWSP